MHSMIRITVFTLLLFGINSGAMEQEQDDYTQENDVEIVPDWSQPTKNLIASLYMGSGVLCIVHLLDVCNTVLQGNYQDMLEIPGLTWGTIECMTKVVEWLEYKEAAKRSMLRKIIDLPLSMLLMNTGTRLIADNYLIDHNAAMLYCLSRYEGCNSRDPVTNMVLGTTEAVIGALRLGNMIVSGASKLPIVKNFISETEVETFNKALKQH